MPDKSLRMLFSKSCEYALKAVLYISSRGEAETVTEVRDIAAAIGSPKYFTAKILQSLSKQKIISSIKGPNGGFYLSKTQQQASLYDIIVAMEGADHFDRCVLGLEDCSNAHPCALHKYVKDHKNELKATLKKHSIRSYIGEVQKGKSFLF